MRPLEKQTLVCLDCETTGLNPAADRIIEVAAVVFCGGEMISVFESFICPGVPIPAASAAIHKISDEMVADAPSCAEVLPQLATLCAGHPVVGHGIDFDLSILSAEAQRHGLPNPWGEAIRIDTLRLARHYGDSPTNSLEQLRQHFNLPPEGAHRALNDVRVNIGVFQKLTQRFRSLKEIMSLLAEPIAMRKMPLGKHKGRPFGELPLQYLQWAVRQDFDQDLLFSLRQELRKRKAPRFAQGLEGLEIL